MKVDVQIEAACNFENADDMSVWISVGVRTTSDQIRALLACGNQQFLSAGIIEQAFLREHTNFDIDGGPVVLLQALDRVKSLEADARIDLGMGAHAHRPLQDRFFERAPSPLEYVLFCEGPLCSGDLGYGFGQRPLFRRAAVENAGFIEVDVRLDKARNDKFSGQIFFGCFGLYRWRNFSDTPAGDADVDWYQLA